MLKESEHNQKEMISYQYEENPISFADILLVIARQLRIIIITPSILCFLMIVYAKFFTDPVFTSTSKIMSSSGSSRSIAGCWFSSSVWNKYSYRPSGTKVGLSRDY